MADRNVTGHRRVTLVLMPTLPLLAGNDGLGGGQRVYYDSVSMDGAMSA